jgi:hypothetical protein
LVPALAVVAVPPIARAARARTAAVRRAFMVRDSVSGR